MTGEITLQLQTPQISYSLQLSRNLTFVRGDSGSGKSYLCTLIEQALAHKEDVHLVVSKNVECLVLPRNTSDSRNIQNMARDYL